MEPVTNAFDDIECIAGKEKFNKQQFVKEVKNGEIHNKNIEIIDLDYPPRAEESSSDSSSSSYSNLSDDSFKKQIDEIIA